MIQLLLVRHAPTSENLEGRYAGRRDAPLCARGIEYARSLPAIPLPGRLVCSPMRRCVQTAALLFPGMPVEVDASLCERDFGRYEGMTFLEITALPNHTHWLPGEENAFPDGEGRAAFSERVCAGLRTLLLRCTPTRPASGGADVAVVTHGGVLMAVLERYGAPARDFYDWHLPCCGAFLLEASLDANTPHLRLLETIFPPHHTL